MFIEDAAVLALSCVNVILTVVLVAVYYRNHRLIKSKITLGMLFFALTFLLHNATFLYFYKSIMTAGILETTFFHLVVNFIEMVGILVLLYVTWE